jgi:hypothetical protein
MGRVELLVKEFLVEIQVCRIFYRVLTLRLVVHLFALSTFGPVTFVFDNDEMRQYNKNNTYITGKRASIHRYEKRFHLSISKCCSPHTFRTFRENSW